MSELLEYRRENLNEAKKAYAVHTFKEYLYFD
jgi:hypothetical protein